MFDSHEPSVQSNRRVFLQTAAGAVAAGYVALNAPQTAIAADSGFGVPKFGCGYDELEPFSDATLMTI